MSPRAMLLAIGVAASSATASGAAEPVEQEAAFRRHFVGTSLFTLANFTRDSPDFYEVDYGYWLSKRDVLVGHAITWKYHAPLGIPYTSASFGAADASYPGQVRAFGVGVGYRRFVVGDLFAMVTATPFLQVYTDARDQNTTRGFQLFVVLRAGYHFRLFDDRLYVEPSVAFNFWPINTNLPADFAKLESRWPKYFLFEPGLNVGVKL